MENTRCILCEKHINSVIIGPGAEMCSVIYVDCVKDEGRQCVVCEKRYMMVGSGEGGGAGERLCSTPAAAAAVTRPADQSKHTESGMFMIHFFHKPNVWLFCS